MQSTTKCKSLTVRKKSGYKPAPGHPAPFGKQDFHCFNGVTLMFSLKCIPIQQQNVSVLWKTGVSV